MITRRTTLTLLTAAAVTGPSLILAACGQQQPVRTGIDLDRVLEIAEATMREHPDWTGIDLDRVLGVAEATMREQPDASLTNEVASPPGGPAGDAFTAIDIASNPDAQVAVAAFTERLSDNLNAAKVHSRPLQVTLVENGGLMGYESRPPLETFGPEDKPMFLIQVDAENQRLVASDLQDPEVHRDRGFNFSPGGFFTGYLLGSMLGGQRGFYGNAGPGFNRMKMAPQGYARSGSGFSTSRSKVNAARNARSFGGSRSFVGGK